MLKIITYIDLSLPLFFIDKLSATTLELILRSYKFSIITVN